MQINIEILSKDTEGTRIWKSHHSYLRTCMPYPEEN
jgi:hypothetical protein